MSSQTQIDRLKKAKSGIKASIENKGVVVSEAALIDSYPALIDQIEQGVKLPAETTAIVASYIANGTFLVPETGRYRITTVGKGGDGGRGYEDSGGGGGASGGWSCSELDLTKGQSYPITVTASNSSFGSLLSATAGQDGQAGEGYWGSTGAGGNAGTASGGNIHNNTGYNGASCNGRTGGNGAPMVNAQSSKFLSSSAGGVGGGSNQHGLAPVSTSLYNAYGCGAGGGGYTNFSYANGGNTLSGVIIIELVLE